MPRHAVVSRLPLKMMLLVLGLAAVSAPARSARAEAVTQTPAAPVSSPSAPGIAPPPDPADWRLGAGRAPEIRAQLSPHRQTVLSSEMPGKLIELPLREGDSFKQGQVVAALDCAEHKARLDRARAQEEASRRRLEVADKLDRLNSISIIERDDAIAQLAMARAETALTKVYVERCVITAPFSGRVAARHVQRHQYVAQGEPLLELIDDGLLELEMIVPSEWLTWLKPGLAFQVRVDEIRRSYPAEVTRIGARIDPISQSVKVFGRVAGDQAGLMAGMSGSVEMPVPVPAVAGQPPASAAPKGTGG